jgi:hypothetical protein
MKLTKLTPAQKARLKEIKQQYVKNALTFQEINVEKTLQVIKFVYSLIKKPMPRVFKVSSPYAAQKLANKLKQTKNKFYPFGSYLSVYWQSFYAYYDTFVEFGIIGDKFSKYHQLREFINTGIYATIEFEHAVIVCEKPIVCLKNEKGLHCVIGPAIKWKDGYEQYYINGRKIDKQWFKLCLTNSLSKNEFVNEQNDEKRSAAYMILGEEKIMSLLGAKLIDEVSITHQNGETETIGYFRTTEKLNNFKKQPYAWRKVTCPSTGTSYLTPTDPSLKTAMDVAKFHRPSFVPKKVPYTWFSRS